jgi:hypothetical protein
VLAGDGESIQVAARVGARENRVEAMVVAMQGNMLEKTE